LWQDFTPFGDFSQVFGRYFIPQNVSRFQVQKYALSGKSQNVFEENM